MASLLFVLWIAERPRMRAALVCLSCSVVWGVRSGFAARGSGRALAPVHLAAPSLCPENQVRACASSRPPKFPGVAMESCLVMHSKSKSKEQGSRN
jgi:hypothetical protein